MTKRYALPLLGLLFLTAGCRREEPIVPSTATPVAPGVAAGEIKGFFLLNEGNMGSNKATLDYFDYETGLYTRNIYAERNPGVARELGDVGNDLQIYGDKLYAVINGSHFVEVMEVRTARHLAQIPVPNGRNITFQGQYAYVSSYAGPVLIDPNARLGYVARIDTATLTVRDTCVVGYQPEEMVIVGSKLYVANSGGYRVPSYDNTVSVIDLGSFKEIGKIEVAPNLHRMKATADGRIYVSSRGNNYDLPSRTYVIDTRTDQATELSEELPNSGMALCGDSLYVYSSAWSYQTHSNSVSYAIFDTRTMRIVTECFITDGTEAEIKIPYGIAVNPATREVFVTDAKDYVTPGTLYCFGPDGRKRWSVTTGDIPAHFAFTRQRLQRKP